MKKYPVTKFYIGVFGAGLLLSIVWEAIVIWGIGKSEPLGFDLIFFHAIGVMGIILALYCIFFDLPTAKFSFDKEGITMYVGVRKHEFKWSEFACAGIVPVNVGKDGSGSYTFWVYFSKTYLTEKEKIDFLRKTRRDLDRVAYFEYNEAVFSQIMEVIPEKLRKQLIWDREMFN